MSGSTRCGGMDNIASRNGDSPLWRAPSFANANRGLVRTACCRDTE